MIKLSNLLSNKELEQGLFQGRGVTCVDWGKNKNRGIYWLYLTMSRSLKPCNCSSLLMDPVKSVRWEGLQRPVRNNPPCCPCVKSIVHGGADKIQYGRRLNIYINIIWQNADSTSHTRNSMNSLFFSACVVIHKVTIDLQLRQAESFSLCGLVNNHI